MFARSYFPMVLITRPYGAQSGGYVPTGEYDETGVEDIKVYRFDTDIVITWHANAQFITAGQWYQVYIDGQLRWSGDRTEVTLPATTGNRIVINVGRVAPENRDVNYASRLSQPPYPGNRALLSWYGGRWIDPDQVGFRVHMSDAPGQPVNMNVIRATIPANVGGLWGDGFGVGPFGAGPFGETPVAYSWTSQALTPGTWQFCVVPYDRAGNLPENPPVVTLDILGPPSAPPMVAGKRLWLDAYDPESGLAHLRWNPST
jgi:hypothetical protein